MTARLHENPLPTPLEERLITLIDDHGPIRVGDFMADAIGHPQHGYYMTSMPFGTEGDFTTAPEISQCFGELIGAWLMQAWEELGAPSLFNLIELGPGRGILMDDILRTAKLRPKFRKAARIYMVETSGRLRYEQQKRLRDAGMSVTWTTELHDIPAAPTLIIANEFFDCLPIRQFVRTAERTEPCWRERLVGTAEEEGGNKRLVFTLSEQLYETPNGAPPQSLPEDIFETCDVGSAIIQEIADRFATHKGRALIIDYGHGRSSLGDTLQALKQHQFWPPLASPGTADVTAHVDFAALARTGRKADLLVHGPVLQGNFLAALGLEARVRKLAESVTGDARKTLLSGAQRLIHPDEMGTLFKALCLSTSGLPAPAGFE